MIRDARHWESLENNKVRCRLCPTDCLLTESKTGICGCRTNIDGKLMVDNYGEIVSAAYDPIEKKPLYHYYPGSIIFSTGPNGCNLGCENCQNWEISQMKVPTRYLAPSDLAVLAGKSGSVGAAYTYSEPLIWFEYILDAASAVRDKGLKNVIVSNGYINPDPLKELIQFIDAANIDLKSMRPDFYKKICKGQLEPVKETIECLYRAKIHLEITNLVIPGLNDAISDFEQITDFIAGLSEKIPLHFSAYYPTYKMTRPRTPTETLMKGYDIARNKLKFVYLGNVNIPGKSDTLCPQCGRTLIKRNYYNIEITGLTGGDCSFCKYKTGIVY